MRALELTQPRAVPNRSGELSDLDSDVHSMDSLRSCAVSWEEQARFTRPAEQGAYWAAMTTLVSKSHVLYTTHAQTHTHPRTYTHTHTHTHRCFVHVTFMRVPCQTSSWALSCSSHSCYKYFTRTQVLHTRCVCVHARVRVCACMRVYVRACVCVRVCVCAPLLRASMCGQLLYSPLKLFTL